MQDVFSGIGEGRRDRIHFTRFGDFSLIYEGVYFVLTGDYTVFMDVQQEINLSLMQQFGKEGIDFAYPTQTVHILKAH